MAPKKYEVEKIMDHRGHGRTSEFLVKWKGYSARENTWEPAANCECIDLIDEFNKQRKKRASSSTPLRKRQIQARRTTSSVTHMNPTAGNLKLRRDPSHRNSSEEQDVVAVENSQALTSAKPRRTSSRLTTPQGQNSSSDAAERPQAETSPKSRLASPQTRNSSSDIAAENPQVVNSRKRGRIPSLHGNPEARKSSSVVPIEESETSPKRRRTSSHTPTLEAVSTSASPIEPQSPDRDVSAVPTEPETESSNRSRTDPPAHTYPIRKSHSSGGVGTNTRTSSRNATLNHSHRNFTPAAEIPELEFNVKEIKGFYDNGTGEDVIVVSDSGEHEVAKCKAVAKQNIDLMIDYFLKAVEKKK